MELYGYKIDPDKLPGHIGIIMDGNGRWAKKKGMMRVAGHEEGFKTLKKIIEANRDIGVPYITVYAFSTENWTRPAQEVNFLMKMAGKMISEYVGTLIKNDIRLLVTGTMDGVNPKLVEGIRGAIDQTADCKSYTLTVAFNYGGRKEIIDAIKRIHADAQDSIINIDQLDDSMLSRYMYVPEIPDPDLILRTSGEQRTSNFLLWQAAYSELWFTDTLWPDFSPEELCKAIYDYQQRNRRFGSV